MATAIWMNPGTADTGDTSAFNTIIGTVTSATDQAFTGLYSLKFDMTGTPTTASATTPVILADTGRRISWRRRIDTATTGEDIILSVLTSAPLGIFNIRLTTGGQLTIHLASGTLLATGTKVLAVNTWYRLTLSYTITSTSVYSIQMYVDGVADVGIVNGTTLARTGSDHLTFTMGGGANAANAHSWVDDIYVDNGSDLLDTGNVRVAAKRPFANGTTNGFSTQIGAGGSSYGTGHAPQVNERALSQSNGWSMIGAGSAITEEYNIENPSVGDLSIPLPGIVGVMGWVFAKSLAGETASIILNNVTSNISLTSTATYFFTIGSVYPAAAGKDIGIITDTSLTTVSLYECGVCVAWLPTQPFFAMF